MRVNKIDAVKVVLLLATIIFSYLIIVLLRAETVLFWLNTGIWVFVLLNISGTAVIERLYFLLFGIFFVLPPAILGGIDFLSIGAFFQSISLEFADTVWLEVIITVYLLSFFAAVSKSPQKELESFRPLQTNIGNLRLYNKFLYFSFLVILSFNILESIAVYNQGYAAFFSGELKTVKGLPVLLAELSFICLAIIGVRHRKNYSFYLFVIYAVSLMGPGQRMPGAMLTLVLFVFYWPQIVKKTKFILYILLGLIVGPPVLMLIQTLRAVGFEGLSDVDIVYYYTDIWAVIGHSMDTLKVAVIGDRLPVTDVTPFAKLFQMMNLIADRVFSINLGLQADGFGSAFSRYLAPDLLSDTNVGFASSSIAESYYFAGMLGVVAYGFASAFICRYLTRIIAVGSLLQTVAFFVFVPRFFTSVRNEIFGWIIEGTIFFVLTGIIMWVVRRIFVYKVSTTRHAGEDVFHIQSPLKNLNKLNVEHHET